MSAATQDFDEFYQATSRRLLHQMYGMTGTVDDARAWQHWRSVAHANDPEAWVRTVAWRIAASRWRKARNGLRALARHGRPEHTQPPSPDHVALVAALRRIPAEQRRAIVLYHLAGLSAAEVATETGVRPGTVKARLSRGGAALRALPPQQQPDATAAR